MFRKSTVFFIGFISLIGRSQNIDQGDINNIVLDLTSLSRSYVTPAANGIAHQMTNGWFSSARIEDKLWNISISVQGNLLFIPKKQRSFLIDEAHLSNIRIRGDETSVFSPTSIGNNSTVELEGNIGDETFVFDTPEGINEEVFWHGQLQVGLTLPYRTEFLARYSPRVSISDVNYQSYGIGLHHNLSQWFTNMNTTSWNFSSLVYFTKFDITTSFDDITFPFLGSLNSIQADSFAFGLNLIGSKTLDDFTFTGALNVTTSDYNYSIGSDSGLLLLILNPAISEISNTDTFASGNVAVRYDWNNFAAFSSLSFGQFQNLIVGLNYTFKTKSNSTPKTN